MNTGQNRTLHDALLRLELELLDPAIRKNRAAVTALLADEFCEIGRGGRLYTKAQILEELAAEPERAIQLEDFAVVALGEAAALATYRSVHGDVKAYRSSVWVWRQGRWQLRYHQGTAAALSSPAGENAG